MHLKTCSYRKCHKQKGHKKKALLGVCLLLSYSPLAMALSEEEATAKLTELIKAGQYTQAFALSNEHVMDYGGDPKFDFLTGIAALNVGEFQQAVFAFERAVIVKPKWHNARFNLAKA